MYQLAQIDHVAITTRNMQASVAWYCEILGGNRIFDDQWDGEPAFIQIGSSSIAIFACPDGEKIDAGHNNIAILHIAFKADAMNFKASQEYLKQKNISFRFEDHGVCHSIYFRDPDGHLLEITTYDIPGKDNKY